MKVVLILGEVTALTLWMALGRTGAFAQQEIDPDHFDSPGTEPPDQPKSGQGNGSATRYDGNFALLYAARCSGKQLAPGRYSVTLRSDGNIGHGVLKSKSHFTEITSVIHPQGSKRGADVGRGGEHRQSSKAIRYPSRRREFCAQSDLQTGCVIEQQERIHRNTAIDISEFQEFTKHRQPVSSPQGFRWASEIGSRFSFVDSCS
jgi:hypothetical protein